MLGLLRLQFAPITADLGNKGKTHGQVRTVTWASWASEAGTALPLLGVC